MAEAGALGQLYLSAALIGPVTTLIPNRTWRELGIPADVEFSDSEMRPATTIARWQIFGQFGLKLTYQPGENLLRATLKPADG